MKKWISIVAVAVIGVIGMTTLTGCDLTEEQMKVIADQTGTFAAVAWIAKDNPTKAEMDKVSEILNVIRDNAADVTAGKTYKEVIYPEIVKIVDKDMEPQYRPLTKAAAISLLGSIDLMFALHPEWKAKQDFAVELVATFVTGAKSGLSLDASHPAMLEARKAHSMRLKALGTK